MSLTKPKAATISTSHLRRNVSLKGAGAPEIIAILVVITTVFVVIIMG